MSIEITDPKKQLKLMTRTDLWLRHTANSFSRGKPCWDLLGNGEYYTIHNLHSSVHKTLLNKYPDYIVYFGKNLVCYRLIHQDPAFISLIFRPLFNLQKFAFHRASMNIRFKMIEDPVLYQVKQYIESLDFEKKYGHLLLSEDIGLFE